MCKESYKTEGEDNDIIYYKNGTKPEDCIYHRTDGPAYEDTYGYKAWYVDRKWHREDGPARTWTDGTKYFWLNGIEYSEEDYWVEIKNLRKQKIDDL